MTADRLPCVYLCRLLIVDLVEIFERLLVEAHPSPRCTVTLPSPPGAYHECDSAVCQSREVTYMASLDVPYKPTQSAEVLILHVITIVGSVTICT